MPWYVRKSVRMGPVRWNLSRSGIGMSVGVRGLRVGTGPRGAYVAGGRGGVYFRQSLGSGHSRQGSAAPVPQPLPKGYSFPQSNAPVEHLQETQVAQFTPATADALAQYIAMQRKHIVLFPWALGAAISVNVIAFLLVIGLLAVSPLAALAGGLLVLVMVAASVALCVFVQKLDRQRTHVVLQYELAPNEAHNYAQLCNGLAAIASVVRLQRVESRQVHGDWKHQAGATTSLSLHTVQVLPPGSLRWLETNVPIWAIRWKEGRISVIFLPHRVLIDDGRHVAAVPYPLVQVTASAGRFVTGDRVPQDAHVIGYNWLHPNKDGGPDRRFRQNRQLPVLDVGYVALQSPAGLTLLLQASNRRAAEAFVNSLRAFQPLICAEPPAVRH